VKEKYVNTDIMLVVNIKRLVINSNVDTPTAVSSSAKLDKLVSPQYPDKRAGTLRTLLQSVRVMEPLKLSHGEAVMIGQKRLIPVSVENQHPSLPLTIHDLQLYLANLPIPEGDSRPPDISQLRVSDRYSTVTLDIESFPVTVMPAEECHFVVTLEPHSTNPNASSSPAPTLTQKPSYSQRRMYTTLQSQLATTWSIPCSSGMILTINPLPTTLPPPQDIVISFDGKLFELPQVKNLFLLVDWQANLQYK
jgi:hypothetical protein